MALTINGTAWEDGSPLTVGGVQVSSVTVDKEGVYTIHGSLEFHGVEKPFMATAEIKEANGEITLSATSKILGSDFGIDMPCMVFMCVRDQIDIFAKAVFTKK